MKLWGKSPFEEQAEKEGPEKKMWKNNGQKGMRRTRSPWHCEGQGSRELQEGKHYQYESSGRKFNILRTEGFHQILQPNAG